MELNRIVNALYYACATKNTATWRMRNLKGKEYSTIVQIDNKLTLDRTCQYIKQPELEIKLNKYNGESNYMIIDCTTYD